jgi:tight adherence protein C
MNLVPLLGACAVVGGVGLAWYSLTTRPSKARGNLFAGLPQPEATASDSPSVTQRVGMRVRGFAPSSWTSGMEAKLVQAGRPYGLDVPRLLGVKVLGAGGMLVLWLLVGQPLLAIVFAFIAFVIPDALVAGQRNARQEAMRAAAADLVDQLTICVEAGLGFDAALNRVASMNRGPLADELRRATQDMRAGMPRDQALRAMADRCQVSEVKALVVSLIQSQKHGVSIADTLRVQAQEMRVKRRQMIEEKSAKLTVKMIFPIVLCFLPVFFIITVVPSVAKIFDSL